MYRTPDPTPTDTYRDSIDATIDDFDEHRTLVAPRRSAPRPPPPPLVAKKARTAAARTARGTAPPDASAAAPHKLPAFVPAETVLPVVQYRGPGRPAGGPTMAETATPELAPAHGAAAALRAYAANRVPVALPPHEHAVAPRPHGHTGPPVNAPLPLDLTGPVHRPTPPRPAPAQGRLPPPPRASRPLPVPPVAEPAPAPSPPPMPSPAPDLPVRPPLGRRGQVVVVFGCRGGAGATTLAVNTAAELARAGRGVCVVDLDLDLGDVFVALDLAPQTSLTQVAADAADLDPSALRRRLVHHRSGLYATTQVGYPDDVTAAGFAPHVPDLLHGLAGHFDDIVVDGIRDFDPLAVAALGAADQILLVMTQDVLSVRRAARAIQRLRNLGQADDRIRLVVNRARAGIEIDDAAIQRALGMRVAAAVRDDARVTTALDDGALLSDLPRARGVAADVAELAGLLSATGGGHRRQALPRRPRGFLGRLLGGR